MINLWQTLCVKHIVQRLMKRLTPSAVHKVQCKLLKLINTYYINMYIYVIDVVFLVGLFYKHQHQVVKTTDDYLLER